MKMYVLIFSGCIGLLLTSTFCFSDRQDKLARDILGKWSSHKMKVVFQGRHGGLGVDSLDVQRADWEKETQGKPIITAFKADNTYESWYYDVSGQVLLRNPGGTWTIRKDTIIMTQLNPSGGPTFRLHMARQKELLYFSGVMDFDLDGQSDDHYQGWMQREP